MKAFRRFAREERAARLVELPIPEPTENQVLLRVSHCGICGSDLHAWLNHKGYESVLPEVTFGHELSVTIEKVGDKAKAWKVGDHAIMIALQTPHDPNDRKVDGAASHRPNPGSPPGADTRFAGLKVPTVLADIAGGMPRGRVPTGLERRPDAGRPARPAQPANTAA